MEKQKYGIKKRDIMEKDSSRLIVILLIIVILVTILGTWTIISAINAATVYNEAAAITGKVSVTIAPRPIEESTIREDDNK